MGINGPLKNLNPTLLEDEPFVANWLWRARTIRLVSCANEGRPATLRRGSLTILPSTSILAVSFILAQAAEQRDLCGRLVTASGWHSMASAAGMAMGLERAKRCWKSRYRGGFFNDVGKVGIPDLHPFQAGTLIADEWIHHAQPHHTRQEICRHLTSLSPVLPIIRNHHERWDGTGYPDGLRGNQISQLARIVQVPISTTRLISLRSYKPAFALHEALVHHTGRDLLSRNAICSLFWRSCRTSKILNIA